MVKAALELTWSRPLGLAALALPILLLLLARLLARPPLLATGTLDVWQQVAARAPAAARARTGTPPAVWLLALALTAGALALAGPRLAPPAGPRTFVVLVDHSPSTGLPWLEQDGPARGGETRLARALAEARAWLADHAGPADRVRWISTARAPVTTGPGEAPDAAWLAHPAFRAPPPETAAFDAAGVIVVGDRAPSPEPVLLGWFASGGAAVYGPVSADPEALWEWKGNGLERVPQPGAGGRAALDEEGGALPPAVRGVVQAWAGARGVGLEPADGAARLVVRAAARGAERARSAVARDGWRARASHPPAGVTAPSAGPAPEAWLVAPGGAPLVWTAPGLVEVGLFELEPEGDPALFAVSWAELLDAALLPHPAVVPLQDRAAAGPPSHRAPRPPEPEGAAAAGGSARVPLDAWLAGLSALAALLALAVDRR